MISLNEKILLNLRTQLDMCIAALSKPGSSFAAIERFEYRKRALERDITDTMIKINDEKLREEFGM